MRSQALLLVNKSIVVLLIGFALAAIFMEIEGQLNPEPHSHLWKGNSYNIYNATGLYADASNVVFAVDENGFISPIVQPLPDEMTILFLGDSTTESIYVGEQERFVAQTGESPILSTYNGARSGGNVYDMYYNFLRYTGLGHDFDIVAISTPFNDYRALLVYDQMGVRLSYDDYPQTVQRYRSFGKEQPTNPLLQLEITQQLVDLLRNGLSDFLSQQVAQPPSRLAEIQVANNSYMDNKFLVPDLESCTRYDEVLDAYRQTTYEGLELFKQTAEQYGFSLVVYSFVDGYGAPAESFFVDLRTYFPCGDNQVVPHEVGHQIFDQLNDIYVQTATDLNIPVIDVRTNLNTLFNGEDGGAYTYDGIHPTRAGSDLIAQVIRTELETFVQSSVSQ